MNKDITNSTIIKSSQKLTDRKKEIIILIYKYRFLNRNQIQTLLNHKHFNRINVWLGELVKDTYLKRYYTKSIASLPAIYSLGSKGRKYLKENSQTYQIHENLLDRIWHEKNYSQQFKNRCMLLADVYLSLDGLTKKTSATLRYYTGVELDGMQHLPKIVPDAFFSITEKNGNSKRFFLVIFYPYPIEKELIKRVSMYFSYYKKKTWQNHNPHPFPEIIFVCGENKSKNFLKMIIRKLLVRVPDISFSLTTWQEIEIQGINKNVLQKVTI